MSRSKHIILPNTRELWERGYSLSLYSRSYDSISGQQDFTELGKLVYEYKYFKRLDDARRQEIVALCAEKISRTLKLEEESKEFDFNCCIGVIPNGTSGHSLPQDLAAFLSNKYAWLRNVSDCMSKVKDLPQMKSLPDYNERKETISEAYVVDTNYDLSGATGLLIIDDIYESGSTLREFCRTLKRSVPDIPRFVISLTHLRAVWSEPR
jgi:predicted amidophosphoribosyltransferase